MIDRIPSIRRVMAVEDVFMIRTRLKALLEEHPQLKTLIRKVTNDCSITHPLLVAYFASDIPNMVKSLVLRVILGDPSLYPEGAASPVGLTYYRRVAQYFVHHPKRPLDRLTSDFQKEDIPRPLEKLLGIGRGSPRIFLSQFGLVPYLLFRRGRLPPEGHLGVRIRRSDDLSFLRPFYTSRKITKAVCKALLQERATSYAYAIYFDTGDSVLDLRNMLAFLRVFWQQDRQGAKLQNKIPKAVSDYFGLPRTSLLELAFLVDLLPLVHNGVIDRARLCRDTDSLNLLRILDGVKGSQIENLEMLISDHTSQWLINQEKAETVFTNRELGSRKGRLDTGLYFNMDRLLSRSTGRQFAPYYAAIDETKLKRQINAYFRSLAPSFAEQLLHIQSRFSADFRGIRIRDLSNILFYVWYHTNRGRDRRKILPAIARFALINIDVEQSLTQADDIYRDARHRQQAPRIEPHYPLLEAFYASLSRCYLLYPGYSGPIPENAPVYMPSSVAAGYTGLPEMIKTTGPRRLAWGQDPYESANLPDIGGYESVVPLTPS